METATKTGKLEVEKRRDAASDYRRLLNRWVVTAGRENEFLASITLAVMKGESYDSVMGRM